MGGKMEIFFLKRSFENLGREIFSVPQSTQTRRQVSANAQEEYAWSSSIVDFLAVNLHRPTIQFTHVLINH